MSDYVITIKLGDRTMAEVTGDDIDAERLHEYLNGQPIIKADGTPSTLTWSVSAEYRSVTLEPVTLGETT